MKIVVGGGDRRDGVVKAVEIVSSGAAMCGGMERMSED